MLVGRNGVCVASVPVGGTAGPDTAFVIELDPELIHVPSVCDIKTIPAVCNDELLVANIIDIPVVITINEKVILAINLRIFR